MSKSNKHGQRTAARKLALQILYQADIMGKSAPMLVEERALVPETAALDDYALMLINGCAEQMGAMDARIVDASENWTMDRMPVVDRSLLRLAAFEMCCVDEVPVSVTINEAVNLAKEFGGADSPRFINGILGRIARQLESEAK